MAAILKGDGSSILASEFLDALLSGENNIYIAIGKESEWENDNLPPNPVDSLQDEENFRQNIIGIKRIQANFCSLMIPKVEWKAGVTFKPLDKTIPLAKRATNWYCLTSRNKVYECIQAGVGETQIGSEPDYMDEEVSTPDGYKWKYLYSISTNMINSGLLLNEWIPVSYNTDGVYPGGSLTQDQNSYGDVNANFRLGAFRMMAVATLEDEGDSIPYGISFRQVGLLWNPKDSDGSLIAGDSYSKNNFDINSGQLLYLENKRPIIREPEQSETLKVIIAF